MRNPFDHFELKRIEREASDWIARLNGNDVTEDDRIEFTQWLARNALHREVYDEVVMTWELMGHFAVASQDADRPAMPVGRRAYLMRSPGVLALGAVLVAIFAGLFLMVDPPIIPDASYEKVTELTFDTRIGESLAVDLPDGSHIYLNTASSVEVALSGEQREVRLELGEIYVSVAHDRERPFLVRTADLTVKAVGTGFNVLKRVDNITVEVDEGIVEVTWHDPRNPSAAPLVRRLIAGQQMQYRYDQEPAEVAAVTTDMTAAWRRGKVVYKSTPLVSVVEDLNRYFPERTIIADPDLYERTVSGILFYTDREGALRTLESFLNIKALRSDDGLTRLVRNPEG